MGEYYVFEVWFRLPSDIELVGEYLNATEAYCCIRDLTEDLERLWSVIGKSEHGVKPPRIKITRRRD